MKEVVLGLGHQTSVRSIVQIADEQLRTIHGSPKKLVVRSGALTVEAHRPAFEGVFDSYVFRIVGSSEHCREILKRIASENPAVCEAVQVDEVVEVRLSPVQKGDLEAVHKLCDELSSALVLGEVWRVHGEEYRTKPVSQEALFRALIKFKSSDIHLYPGSTPVFRVDSKLRHSDNFESLSSTQIIEAIKEMAPEKHFNEFLTTQQCSFIYHQVGLGYARVSAFMKAGTPHCTLRFLPEKIPTFEELAIPRQSMQKLGKLHFGL
ncbi:MAG: hypothetical protein KDA72_15305, partial [Planctomycetales bacterium]|nr:hypothetical protein [Planctomycetales bacterium]